MVKYDPRKDYNDDGEVSKAENKRFKKENPKADPLSREELAQDYGYALRVLEGNDELGQLFEEAYKRGDTPDKFIADLMNSTWWAENSEFARKAYVAEKMGGADWAAMLETASQQVQAEATRIGVDLTADEVSDFAKQTIAGGWDTPGRTQLLTNALSSRIGAKGGKFMQGAAGNAQEVWMRTAAANGLQFSDNWFASQAQSVAMDLMTNEDVERMIREQAASLWPTLSDKIMAGQDVTDIASGYINIMAQEFEIDPQSISLNDPMLRQAFTGVGENGEPSVEGLWAFQQRLRQDPRWMQTRQAAMEISNVSRSVMQAFGMVG